MEREKEKSEEQKKKFRENFVFILQPAGKNLCKLSWSVLI